VYSSQSIALALLEVFVHVDKSEVPKDFVVMAIDFTGRSVYRPRSAGIHGIGQHTAAEFSESLWYRPVLRVPSVIVPREFNFVLFPRAQGFHATIAWTEPLHFDDRLFSIGSSGQALP
jgi:RES domain-containing protein